MAKVKIGYTKQLKKNLFNHSRKTENAKHKALLFIDPSEPDMGQK